jgi:hypothetical protein
VDRIFSADAEHAQGQLEEEVARLGALGGERRGNVGADVSPCPPGTGNGSVAPEDGFSDGDFEVGWGVYQTSWEANGVRHGDGAFHPGMIVRGQRGSNAVTLCFLLDGTPRAN